MTLPTNIIFPLRADLNQVEDINKYLGDFTFELQRMYEQLAQGINGDIRANVYTQRNQWLPELAGTGVAGTFTYTRQVGWAYRQGLLTDIWFDVEWTGSGAAAGNLYLILPYRVAKSNGMPFANDIQSSTLNYGAGRTVLSINAIPDTFRGEFWTSGSGVATANLPVAGAGRVIGFLRYLGVQNET